MSGEWWTFERYGKTGAMSRLESTIDALHLLAIKTPKPTPPPAPADLPADVAKPALIPSKVPAVTPRTPRLGGGRDANTDIENLLARTASRRIGEDGGDDDGVDVGSSRDGRRARTFEDEIFDDRPLVQLNPVTRTPGELQMQQEEQVYGRTNIHLIVESPATDSYVRNPVDEGFYDPTRTDVSLWNLDKLIARLTREDRKQEVYFEGADRHLKMEGYPIHEMIMRAANTELYADEPLLHTRIQPPAPYTGKDHWYDFKIQLNWIQFIEHALFTREDKLCRDLDDLCAEYKRRDTINLVSHYDSKIRGLRSLLQSQTYDSANFERQQLLKQQADPTAPIDQYTRMMHQQKQLDTLLLIREAIDMRDREEHEQRTLFKHIYAKWMDVRATRSEVTREMKAKGFWQNELQPVASARSAPVSVASSPTNAAAPPATAPEAPPPPGHTPREEAPIASPSAALASPSDTGVIGYPGYTLANPQPAAPASSGPPPGLRPLDVSSPMATQQLVLDTPAGVAASEQAAARLALLNASRPEFSPPPPPPPPPPEMPPPNNEPLITEQMKREQAALNPSPSPSPTNAQSQPHDAAYLAQQQQLNAQWQSMTPEQQQAWIQQQQQYQQQMYDPTYMQQQHAYYQQQQLAYQHFLAQQQSQSPTNADLKPNEEQKEQPPQPTTMNALPISSPHAIGLPSAANKKGRHVTLADTLAQERERTERERVESASDAANRSLRIDPNAAASQPIGDSDAVSTRAGDLALEKRAGLLKETYVGYPSNFKVGRHQLDWKHKPEDQIVYRQEKAAWVDAIKAELRETKLRLKLERCLKNGGVDPQEPLTPEQQQQRDQELYDAIEKRMSTMRRRPGGTKYLPVYNEDIKVFDTSRCLLEEQARRKMIEGYKVFLRVYVNGMRVCDTEPQLMSFPRFKVHFDTTIPLSLVAMPSSINVQVYHSRGLLSSDELLGEVGLPVPEFGAPVSFQEYTFSGAHIDPESAVMKHTPTPKDPFGPSRYVTAIIEAGVAWGKDVAQAPESMSNILSSFAENDRPRLAMRNKMNAMPGKKNIDPNDPRNADMLEHMHRSTMLGHKKKHTFVATESQVEGRLTDPKYHQSSARSLVLAARNDSGFIRDPVPLKDEEISSQLYSYIRIRDEADESEWEKYQATHKIDTELLYEREQARAQAKILNVSHDIHDVAEVVNERDLPVFSVNTSWLNTLFEKRRDLRPKRETHRIMAAPKSCNIVVQVVKGQNMPVRRVDGMTRNKAQVGNSSTMTLEQQEYVRTFVEISFQDSCKRTSCSRGTNPRWDQLISLPFRPPAQSFSPAHLSTCNDMVNFNVFDEITTSNEVDPRLTRTRLMHSEQRWLGSFSIPFTTIYHNGRIDGAFSINVPPHLLGYEQPHADRDAFLFIYATLDPVLTTPPPRPDRFHYMNPFYARAIEWVSELKARSPAMSKRAFMSVAGDISSNPQFLCRYITAERPPDKYQAPNVFTRFVSIIPFQDDAQASLGTVKDIWCTSKDFMALQGGDWEEHAILLNNYFTWYDANMADSGAKHHNYVALGEGFPEGDTAYVLRLGVSGGSLTSKLLYNAVTGRMYDLHNPTHRQACPLQRIAIVFNADNIWANVQEDDDPTRCGYELFNPQQWHPFFNAAFNRDHAQQQYSIKFDTIQKPIHYTEESFEWYVNRASKIERLIERRFEKWRTLTTHWDYGVCKVLRDFLLSFESHAQGDDVAITMDRPLHALKNAYGSIYGFPLHFRDSGDKKLLEMSDDNPIVSAVRNTKIHENEDAKTVFALAVYIHPYPNRMGSVWIYVASLTEK